MANQDKDKKNQTTDQLGENNQTTDRGQEQQKNKTEQDTSIDLSSIDRQEGNLAHGETGGHQLGGEDTQRADS